MGKLWARLLCSHSSVQCFSDTNQMNTHNLAIVFGPTLFQTDGQDYKAGKVVEDLINHYVVVFSVRPSRDWGLGKAMRGGVGKAEPLRRH